MPKNNIKFRLVYILLLLISLLACERETENPLPPPDYFVATELLARYTSSEITNLVSDYPDILPFATFLIRHNVLVYKIVYKTVDTKNISILASGALLIPDNRNPMPVLSFQHGTIREESEAPSNFSPDLYFAAVLNASAGYITALPDYLGYGSSRQVSHPYEHGRSLATASRDMLRAVREFDLLNKDFRANDKLFLTGYSEGGYATMALLKLLEEQHMYEFNVTAATVGAGAYNKSAFAKFILEADGELTHLNSFLWVLDTYNKVYGMNRPYNHYFNEPYAETIRTGGVFANTQLNPVLLFKDTFREDLLNGNDTNFINALADNDIYDWKPNTPLQLYHGTDDDFVFYFNSSSAYEAMTARGASSVELIPVPGGDHSDSIDDYFAGTFLFFSNY